MKIPDNPMTEEDKLNWATHNLELEGIEVSEDAKKISKDLLEKKITIDEAIKKIKKILKDAKNVG